jgi:hypothetical protein
LEQHELPRIGPYRHFHIGSRSIEHGGNAIRRVDRTAPFNLVSAKQQGIWRR